MACVLATWLSQPGKVTAESLIIVPEWGRFEQQFRSAVNYANPLEDATMSVVFTSPLGETFKAWGFWDGGRAWRVRFSPNFPGVWKFQTTCSDASNQGLNHVEGEFTCTFPGNVSKFDHHGPVRVARDKRHFEYQDHTPFFWLGDTVGEGAIRSTAKEWEYYAEVRSRQKFSVVRCLALQENPTNDAPISLNGDHLHVNLDYFRKLDHKTEMLNRANLVDAITPFNKTASIGGIPVDTLSEEQAIALVRYLVARWDAYDVAWVLPCDDARPGRWKRIGSAVFGDITHSPVVVNSGEASWMLDELRAEPWLDALGYECSPKASDDSMQWIISGPMNSDWTKTPIRPLINLALPCESTLADKSHSNVSAEMARQAAYWSLLNSPLAGVTYVACGISNWDATVDAQSSANSPQTWHEWQIALFSPGATNMGVIADAFSSVDFWRLRPEHELLAMQKSMPTSPADYIAAAHSTEGDMAAVYVPQNWPIELNVKKLPASPTATWIDVRTGRQSSAVFHPSGETEKMLPPQGCADWFLVIKGTGK